MRGALTEFASRIAAGEVFEGLSVDASPFVREGGEIFMRFDAISLVPANDALGGANVSFGWRGRDVYVMRLDRWMPGDSVVLSGMDGRMGVKVETS